MKFSDLFVPKYLNSNPEVRMKFVKKTKHVELLEQIVKNDSDKKVVQAARDRINELSPAQSAA